ncbi:MAG: transglutaminase-like domain-containing protein [Bacteroidales bacterium]|nr:transglutaminase-like domain-containing protein [Bacteroidales bacterium]
MKLSALTLLAFAMLLTGCGKQQKAPLPQWVEADSAQAIEGRIARDFSLPFAEGAAQIIQDHPNLLMADIRAMADSGLIETMWIDEHWMMFRKSRRNFDRVNREYNDWTNRGWDASPERMAYADSVIRYSQGQLADGGAHRVRYRFTIDVPYDAAYKGDTLRVWMPFPREVERQCDIKLISSYPSEYVLSKPEQSAHSTIYFEHPVVEGDTAHFEYVAEFTGLGAYFSPATIRANIKPYDTEAPEYKKYTAFDSPHIVRLDSLANAIVGSETNPYRQSELVYDYIVKTYPWAGAREYSTLECIPKYVIESGHGDCGQVALLYISLMRTLGVPARWESGWMLHPGELNLHDWAETYYEGVGWVPVDVSFGRYTGSKDAAVRNFYSTGIDAHRLVANQGIGDEFYPKKRYIRSETVDSQMGEVEISRGNLFYPLWEPHFEIIQQIPISL